MRTDLVWLGVGPAPATWALGSVFVIEPNPRAVAAWMADGGRQSPAAAFLFWDPALGLPEPDRVRAALALPGDLWHAGLKLGLAGRPSALDFVAPTWMLHRDPDPRIEATSWRLSLRACLMKGEVLRRMTPLRSEFETLEMAALEFGHRCVRRGVLTRHVPALLGSAPAPTVRDDSFAEQLLFIRICFGVKWTLWCAFRSIVTGAATPVRVIRALGRTRRTERRPDDPPFRIGPPEDRPTEGGRVSVLVPTLERYPYLRTLLGQLRRQTVAAWEILVIDQTPAERRDVRLASEYRDLPLQVVYRDLAGQCSSRNAGLALATGDYVLFVDDDDEVPDDLIARHLRALHRHRSDVSSGVAQERGAGPLPADFTLTRASDVFPTNNSLVRREVLTVSGLFDLAYERGARADHDLGMRLYLSGRLMVLDPSISVVHHHAPQGGLRAHKARVVTYASSRQRLLHRQLPSPTEIYLASRYYTAAQVREMLWLSVFGTFSIRGGSLRKALKLCVSLALLPHTLWRLRQAKAQAAEMRRRFPQIPALERIAPASARDQANERRLAGQDG